MDYNKISYDVLENCFHYIYRKQISFLHFKFTENKTRKDCFEFPLIVVIIIFWNPPFSLANLPPLRSLSLPFSPSLSIYLSLTLPHSLLLFLSLILSLSFSLSVSISLYLSISHSFSLSYSFSISISLSLSLFQFSQVAISLAESVHQLFENQEKLRRDCDTIEVIGWNLIYMYIYICIYICLFVCFYKYLYIYMILHTYIFIFTYSHICIFIIFCNVFKFGSTSILISFWI